MKGVARNPSLAPRLGASLVISLLIAAGLMALLLRPATRAPIPPAWEPRPAIPDQIPGAPGPPPR